MKKYRRPPIVERVLSFGVTLPEELFERRLESWRTQIKEALPEIETVTNWHLNLAHKDGMPVLDPASQRMTLRHRFWKGDPKHRDKGIQLWRDRIAFNLLGSPECPRHFEELEAFAKEWWPQLLQTFEITTVHGVTLEYINRICPNSVPKFVDLPKQTIRLGEVFPVFGRVPMRGSATPPYNFEHNVTVRAEPPLHLQTKLAGPIPRKGEVVHLWLRIKATTEHNQRAVPAHEVFGEVAEAHGLILEAFEAYFSDAAKLSFEPYDASSTTSS